MTIRTIIGPNHKKPRNRVWIEGRRLIEAGFRVGATYNRCGLPSTGIWLQLDPKGRYKVSGKGEKPIIDLTGEIIGRFFPPPATHVAVTFFPSSIHISNE